MNQARRKSLNDLHKRITEFQSRWAEYSAQLENFASEASDLHGELEALKDEEQEYFDNMPEGFQTGEKGQTAESAISELDTALEALSGFEGLELSVDLDEALEAIDNAQAG